MMSTCTNVYAIDLENVMSIEFVHSKCFLVIESQERAIENWDLEKSELLPSDIDDAF